VGRLTASAFLATLALGCSCGSGSGRAMEIVTHPALTRKMALATSEDVLATEDYARPHFVTFLDARTFATLKTVPGTLVHFDPADWNIYLCHFSAGEHWSGNVTAECMKLLDQQLLPMSNLFAYGQVESRYGSGQFLRDLQKFFGENTNKITVAQIKEAAAGWGDLAPEAVDRRVRDLAVEQLGPFDSLPLADAADARQRQHVAGTHQ